MSRTQRFLSLLLGAILFPAWAMAGIQPGQLAQALENAHSGDTLELEPGLFSGHYRIDTSLTLQGSPGTIIDGGGKDTILTISAPDVSVKGLLLRNSGDNLTQHESAIFIKTSGRDAHIQNNRINAQGFGIWVDSAPNVLIERNRITGNTEIRSQDRGNGIHLHHVNGAIIRDNTVCQARDGIYINVSNHNSLVANRLCNQRYGIHYMYSNSNTVRSNRSWGNRTGYALMQSTRLEVINNRAENDKGYGFLLNYITQSTLRDNAAVDIKASTSPDGTRSIEGGEGKALFIYNSQKNRIHGNTFARTAIGIHMTAGSENNEIHGNSLISNRTQVKYVSNRAQEWSKDGRGNYWSDYMGWDINDDGIGDVPHEPNDAVDRILWTYPMARVLMNSPAVELMRWVQSAFPILRPRGVKDSHPLMRPPETQEERS
ncbi:nitrous oxide reductase family maturation protein NosD [Salicola sp. Rm-C-2C1-2]|uniref:nitrous oxide reductase family maturation protein NosD n=1 Tax=Salicola sp. Rm-C-2C1-2 TaxID=3141321 RepID=UPI0032E5228D